MQIQTVITVSLTFAAFIFGTFAVKPGNAGEAKGTIVAKPTRKVTLAAMPELRTAKPIDNSLVPRAKTTRLPLFGMKAKASKFVPASPSRPQVQTNKMEETKAVESTGTSELEVNKASGSDQQMLQAQALIATQQQMGAPSAAEIMLNDMHLKLKQAMDKGEIEDATKIAAMIKMLTPATPAEQVEAAAAPKVSVETKLTTTYEFKCFNPKMKSLTEKYKERLLVKGQAVVVMSSNGGAFNTLTLKGFKQTADTNRDEFTTHNEAITDALKELDYATLMRNLVAKTTTQVLKTFVDEVAVNFCKNWAPDYTAFLAWQVGDLSQA